MVRALEREFTLLVSLCLPWRLSIPLLTLVLCLSVMPSWK